MKIKTKLQLIIVAIVIFLTGIVSMGLLWQKQAKGQYERELLVMELNGAIFELAKLREEYFLYREERLKVQFLLIHNKIRNIFDRISGTFTRADENVYTTNMRDFHTRTLELFNKLIRIDEGATLHTEATQAVRERIINQMLVNVRSLSLEGFEFLREANKTVMHQSNLIQLFSNVIFGLLALLIASFVVIIIRSIVRPLIRLHKGTEIISGGNLDYKTNIKTRDEIGQLSRAFDSMTEHLKQITVSRDELGKEIEIRKQAEEALKASREQLRALAGRLQEVREEERAQIAREIHDELGGALTGIKIDVSFLTKSVSKIENDAVRTSLLAGTDPINKSIDTTIKTVRRIMMNIRPSVLDDLGLVAALEWQLKDFETRTGIRYEFSPPVEDINLDADLSTTLFRIFQESLTNVARHSGATEVHIRLRTDADSPILEVEDNGKGVKEEENLSSKSLGFLGMRERVQMFGGRVTVKGTPGKGTIVTVEIPPVEKRKKED